VTARRVTYHLTPRAWFDACDRARAYMPEAFDRDGFVHCTDSLDEVIAVGNRYYGDDPRPYVALVIDVDALSSPMLYEDEARRYPHVYGPVDRAAIIAVRAVRRAADGTFVAVAGG